MAAGEINDGQSPKSQADWTGNVKTFVIRSTVREGARHPHDCFPFHGFQPAEVKLACDAAHVFKDFKKPSLPSFVPRRDRSDGCCRRYGAILADKTQGCETSATVPTDAWEHCPNPGVACGNETIHPA
jgi:hypothetical protein